MAGFSSRKWLILSICLLLIQLFLRSYKITSLLGYADESLVPEKLLLYYYLAFFETDRIHYLAVGRLAIALFSLLGAAALFGIGKRLFDARVGLLAQALYTFNPFAFFYDRMILADPMTLALIMVMIWVTLIWLKNPTRRMGIVMGIVLILPPLAKLTALAVVIAPILAILLIPPTIPNMGRGFRDRVQYYRQSLIIMYAIFGVFWAILSIPVVIGEIRGGENRSVVIDDYLLNLNEKEQNFVENLIENTRLSIQQTVILYGYQIFLLTLIAAPLLLWRRPRQSIFLLILFVLSWARTISVGSYPSSRYLQIGVPFLLLILAAGTLEMGAILRRANWIAALVAVYSIAWGMLFWTLMIRDPINLGLPEEARWRFIQSMTAAYGQVDAIHYLEDQADQQGKPVKVFAVLGSCHLMRLYMDESINLTCVDLDPETRQIIPTHLQKLEAALAENDPVYFFYEPAMHPAIEDLPVEWAFVQTFPRPHGGVEMELWVISRSQP